MMLDEHTMKLLAQGLMHASLGCLALSVALLHDDDDEF